MPLLRDVYLAADDRVQPSRLRLVVELDGAEKISMIRHGHGWLPAFDYQLHQASDFAGPVQQGVIGVAVKVNEWFFRHSRLLVCASTWRRYRGEALLGL